MNSSFYTSLSIFIISFIAIFLEVLVFNEEVLLTLCFISFVFFVYHTQRAVVSSIFEDRAKKMEAEVLVALEERQKSTLTLSNSIGLSKKNLIGITLFAVLADSYNTFMFQDRVNGKKKSQIFLVSNKLVEATRAESSFTSFSQKKNIQQLSFSAFLRFKKKAKK